MGWKIKKVVFWILKKCLGLPMGACTGKRASGGLELRMGVPGPPGSGRQVLQTQSSDEASVRPIRCMRAAPLQGAEKRAGRCPREGW